MRTNSGTITQTKDSNGNIKFLATSDYEDKSLECWSMTGADFYLWVIAERVEGRNRRLGLTGRE